LNGAFEKQSEKKQITSNLGKRKQSTLPPLTETNEDLGEPKKKKKQKTYISKNDIVITDMTDPKTCERKSC
jgi:hypothetical protein